MTPVCTTDTFEELKSLDGCTLSNAIESFNVRLRNEGFIAGALRCRFPSLGPMLGYAVTGRIRTSSAPMSSRGYYNRMDFWRHVATIPAPRVIVVQDVDPRPGFGAFFGEVHAAISQALECVGYVTNGAVRDIPAIRALGFHLFSGGVSVSHAYAHMIEFGEPVEIGGLKISPGDLTHGDCHGVQIVPPEIAEEVPAAAAQIMEFEQQLMEFCRSSHFSLDALENKLKETAGSL